jgi:O-antigen/teichoic acid export membrane protein
MLRGIFTLGMAQLASLVLGMIVTVLLPRYLGDVSLGKLAFAGALMALFGLLADLGTMTYLTKEISRDPSRGGPLTRSALLTRVPLGILAALLMVGFVLAVSDDELTRRIVYVSSVAMIVVSLGNTLGAALQGLQRMRALGSSMVIGKLLYAVLVAALLASGFGPVEVAAASLLSSLVGAIFSAAVLGRALTAAGRVASPPVRAMLFGGMPFFVWQAALVIYGQIDFVLLALMTNDAVVGWYAAAYRIIMIPAFLPTTVITAAFPALSAAAHDRVAFAAIARSCMRFVALSTVPMAFGILVLPDRFIALLGYPDVFSNSVIPIVLLALHIPIVGIDMVLGTMLNALDKQRAWALTGVAAAVLNPALNLIAIPLTQSQYANGAIGAAAVTTLTELFMLVVGLVLLPRASLGRETASYVLRCFAAAAVMAGAVWLERDAPLAISVATGIVVYTAAGFAVRIVTREEAALILRFVRRRPARSPALA